MSWMPAGRNRVARAPARQGRVDSSEPWPQKPAEVRLLLQPSTPGAAGPVAGVPESVQAPPSHAQARLWFSDQSTSEPAVYNLHAALRLAGPLRVEALRSALQRVCRRHESLRTTFRWIDGSLQQVVSSEAEAELVQVDLEALAPEAREASARELAQAEVERPFDLARGPLLRSTLIRLAADRHVLVLCTHHIVSDGGSIGILLEELRTCYGAACRNEPPRLPALALQYAEFSRGQRQTLQGEVLDGLLAYWTENLRGAPPLLDLPTDRARPPVPSHQGARATLHLSQTLEAGLKALARQQGATLYMALLAGFKICLVRYGSQTDLVVGSPVAGRLRAELAPLIGLFVNMLPLRTDLGGDPTVREVLARVRATTLGALGHQDLPFDRLVEALNPPRSRSHAPVIQAALTLQAAPPPSCAFHDLEETPLRLGSRFSMFDLGLSISASGDGLVADLDCATDLFDPETAERMLVHFGRVLEAMVADPGRRISRLPVLTEAERQRILVEWNDTARPLPPQPVQGLFEAQAARSPGAIAAVLGGLRLSYAELNQRANQVAHVLIRRGAGPGTAVAVLMERSLEFLVAALGALKAGAAYVPLDPSLPGEQLSHQLEDSGSAFVLTRKHLHGRLPAGPATVFLLDLDGLAAGGEPREDPPPRSGQGDLACILYTSGSTGRPKGVEVRHLGIVRLLFGVDYVQLGPRTRILQAAPLAFDAATFEIWAPLLHGGRCILYPEAQIAPAPLQEALAANGVNTLWLTAALFNAVIDHAPACLAGVEQLLIGGEALSVPHVRRALDLLPGLRICNGYGPTEATTFSCCHPILPDLAEDLRSIPIGRPIGNSTAYILDPHGEPVPIGAAGELHLGGSGLARGYRNLPEATAAAFIANPFDPRPGSRLYRTGDRARHLADGRIEFLGRRDRQVKVRGHRIEPGEIEAALARYPGLSRSAVEIRTDAPGGPRIVAFLETPRPRNPAFTIDGLAAFLRRKLPAHMVPDAFAVVDPLPMRNGKVDRQRLGAIPVGRPGAVQRRGPSNPTEALIVQIWEELLGVEPVGVLDDFFDIGGHSLLAFAMLARLEETFGRKVPIGSLYAQATVQALAKRIAAAAPGPPESAIAEIQAGSGGRPFFYLHGDFNGGGFYCRNLARHLDPGQAFQVVHPFGLAGQPAPVRLELMAAEHLQRIRAVQPEGPYLLGGHCNGALEAYEIAQQLRAGGQEVQLLVLIDPPEPVLDPQGAGTQQIPDGIPADPRQRAMNRRFQQVMRDYRPQPYDRPVCLLRSARELDAPPEGGWARLVTDLQGFRIGTGHLAAITRNAAEVGAQIQRCLDRVQHA